VSNEIAGIWQRNEYNKITMGQIKVLDQNMVNMIAAGEVIERPASVVKELMENSLDAGATRITVAVEDGGRKLISVTDDGCGMDAEDLGRAFESHTTSKITRYSDLYGISTLGFRGEALASIGSVAQVRAVSRIPDSAEANCIEIDCGNKSGVSPCSADFGTTIEIRDIFYKLPARRKFLKSANTEMSHIIEQFTRIALGCYFAKEPFRTSNTGYRISNNGTQTSPQAGDAASRNLDLTLIHNNRELYRLSGKENLRRRVAELFPMLSREVYEDFLEAESDERGLHIFTLLGKPGISKTSNKFQYIFLNGRFIRDKFISHAIKEAYRGLLEPDRFPVIFLFIQMPYEDYDVNVHPTKIEVRFYNANLVYSQVLAALREKLLSTQLDVQAKLPAAANLPVRDNAPLESHRSQNIADAIAEFLKIHGPVKTVQQYGPATERPFSAIHPDSKQVSESATAVPKAGLGEEKFLQIHDSFIVAQTNDGFVIIDQHALHERIIYEHLHKRMSAGKLESQKLLIPESFELTEGQTIVIDENAELFDKLGIELVPFGPRAMAIQAFPGLLANVPPVDFVQDLIDLLDRRDTGLDAERLLEEVLNMAACKAAIKAGQKLSDSEIKQLLIDRGHIESASRCPHGRPTTIKFSISDLEKQFKRT
jgi:DNA mismatch repair protein MutL